MKFSPHTPGRSLWWAVLASLLLAGALFGVDIDKPSVTIKCQLPDAMRDGRDAIEAVTGAERMTRAEPKNFTAWYQLGLAYGANRQPKEAAEALRKAAALRPQSAEVWHHLGANLWETGEYDECAAAFRRAVKIDPKYGEAWNGLAVAASQVKQLEEAGQAMEKAFKLSPESARLWNTKGLIFVRLKQASSALVLFERAVQLDPSYTNGWYNRGLMQQVFNDNAQAIESMRRAISTDPNFLPARLILVTLYYRTGEIKKAEDLIEETARIDPNDGSVWMTVGITYLNQSDWAKAEPAFRKGIALKFKVPDQRSGLGVALLKLGRLDESEKEFEDVLRGDSRFFLALANFARLREEQKRLPEARELARKALAVRQDDLTVWKDFSRLCALTGQWSEAEQAAARQTELVPMDFDAWMQLGEAQEAQNKKTQCEQAFRKAAELKPTEARPWAGLARCVIDPAAALEAGQKAVKFDPKSVTSQVALGRAWLKTAQDDPAKPEFTKALGCFLQATELDPKDLPARKFAYSCQVRLGQTAEAARSEVKLTALGSSPAEALAASTGPAPDTFEGYLEAARPLLAAGRLVEGLSLLQKAYEMHPEDFDLSAKVVEALQALHRHQEGIDFATKVRDRFPNKAGAWLTYGTALLKTPRAEEALAAVQKAVDLEPENQMTWYALAVTHCYAGRYFAAIPRAFRAVELAPDNARCWQLLVSCWISAGELSGGESRIREWLAKHPDSSVAWRSLSTIQAAGLKFEAAVQSGFRAVTLNAEDVEAWNILGSAYLNTQNAVGALDAFDHALRLQPNHSEACTNLAWIRFVNGQFPEAIELLTRALTTDGQNKRSLAILVRALYREGENERAKQTYDRLRQVDAAFADKVRQEAPGDYP